MRQDTKYLEKSIDYKFKNENLLKQALTHRSYNDVNNERLEFLGDALLSIIIAENLFHKYPKLSEGSLTRARSSLVKGDTLADLADGFKINNYIFLGDGELKSGGLQRRSILADCLEAIIAAIYLDSDYEICKSVVSKWYLPYFKEEKPLEFKKDPKSILQEWLQARQKELPEYSVVSETGHAHDKTFIVDCRIVEFNIATQGKAKNRRKAEQDAAAKAMQEINDGKYK